MRFLMIYSAANPAPPSPETMAAMGVYMEESTKAGVLLDTGGMVPPTKGTRVRQSGGKFAVTDGPFPETKELIAGYAIIQARSHDEALEHSRRFMSICGDGTVEILQMFGAGELH